MHPNPLPCGALRQHVRPAPTVVALACALLMGAPALAQTAPAEAAPGAEAAAATNALPTVTVTARKRSEKMLEVPMSIQSFSEKDLRASGSTDIKDLTTQAGFNFSSAQGSGAQGRAFGVTTFRGLQGELNFPWENSGGVFIDGIFISGGVSSIGMTDVARVEVLKGPQNAFFGRSTFGGAVNFITKQPAGQLRGTINASLNQRGSNDVDVTIEGPLIPDLLNGRISFGSRNKTALYHATDGGNLGAENTKFVAGTLHFSPTDDLWVRLRGHYQKDEDSTPATAFVPAAGNTSCTGATYTGIGRDGKSVQYTPGTAYFCGTIPSFKDVGAGVIDANTAIPAGAYAAFVNNSLGDPFLAKTPRLDHAGMAREIKRASVQAGYSLPLGMEAAFNLGYNQANSASIFDLDRTKTQAFYALQTNVTHDLTADARLSTNPKAALRGVVGVSYFKSTYQLSQLNLNSALGATAAVRDSGNYLNLDSAVPAAYGSVEYDVTQQITASFETRRQHDKIEATTYGGAVYSNAVDNWLPRMTLRFKPTADLSFYVNAARGVQPLTVNTGYVNASAAGQAYMRGLYPDLGNFTPQPKLKSLEFGAKQRVNDWLQYSAAVYDQKWQNRLTSSAVFNPTTCGTTTGTPECPFTATGAGVTFSNDATIRGLELQVDAQLASNWSASAYVDIKHATWDKYNSAAQSAYGSNRALALTGTAVAFDGNALGRVPKVTVSANTTYRFGLSDGWSSFLRGDLTYVGKQWETDFNFAQSKAYSRLDARWGFEKGNTSLELFVRNLTNDRGWVSVGRTADLSIVPLVNFSQQALIATVQEERAFGVRLRYGF
ncbi:TonB-dependent receptor [Roseateles cellulosilyticus]|uniref:TonB-dependent receptor n=1 Tax=Pelomonas cellulosilytica TaxID=2906762 RepID=A0ABS8XJ42_9BURK|nr:TonB-dependent receptor [Pelomonas sp. P8]MCE4552879.1 TonB-dependent receptor [Pelomonas sp. P8]